MADCDQCRDGDCPRCDIFTCGCLHEGIGAAREHAARIGADYGRELADQDGAR